MHIVLNVTLRAKEGKADEAAAEFARMNKTRSEEEGILAHIITQPINDPHEFRILEIYRDSEALQEHMRVTADDPHRKVLAGLLEGPPNPAPSKIVRAHSKFDDIVLEETGA